MRNPLLIADGDIPTTRIVWGILEGAFGKIEMRPSDALFGVDTRDRHIVISRLCHPQFRWLPRYLASRGEPYAFFLDDNFWELTQAVDVHLAPFYTHPQVRKTLDDFIVGASGCFVMSRRLGRYIEDRFPDVRASYVVPGFDFARIRDAAAATPVAPKSSGEIRIGYPTSRRSNVTPLLVPVIEEISRRYGSKVRFEFVGWSPDALTRLDNVRLYPHIADYDRFLAFKLSRRWDIGIAPLMGEPFESYKTNVKYREYGGCRIAGVYSRVAPYTDYVTDGSTGILVDNTIPAWIEALERLIRDEALRQHVVERAYADIESRLNQRTAERQLKSLLEGFRAGAPSASSARDG